MSVDSQYSGIKVYKYSIMIIFRKPKHRRKQARFHVTTLNYVISDNWSTVNKTLFITERVTVTLWLPG